MENLDARERIRRATTLSTEILLGKAFRSAGSEPLPSGFTVMDMGSAHGSTARAAAKEYGCNVSCAYHVVATVVHLVNAGVSHADKAHPAVRSVFRSHRRQDMKVWYTPRRAGKQCTTQTR